MGLLRFIAARFAAIDRRPAPVIDSHNELGHYGERVALASLRRCGYKLVDRNYRTKAGEIDLICRDGKTLCFVEVKTRHNGQNMHPADAVHLSKQRRTVRAAQHYLQTQGHRHIVARFDVVEVFITTGQIPECRLIADAYSS
ncbi:MAG: YraN family protein [Verrucomicrobia bacterium Tous-C9LFEB]|nr:MAG: YraN family protein [Verrucomicrobia bacterium Tous-C9LFEB]